MCKETEREKCEYKDDLKGCALKHIDEARKLIAKGKYQDADTMLRYAEEHLKEV